MGRTSAADALARSGPAELAAAQRHRDGLLAAARSLVAACDHDPAHVGDASDCPLRGRVDDDVCALAHRLARIEPRAGLIVPVTFALAAFLCALTDAVDAVRTCRQTRHVGGTCWFGDGPGDDGCVEILRLVHRAG
jgi:hypothetical protein